MDQGILWTSFMDVPQDDNRMGIHSAAAALHISSSFDQRHAELAPPRSAYPPSLPLHPFSPSPGAGLAQPTLLSAANYGVAPPKLGDEGRGGLPIIPFSLLPSSMSFVPVLITLHPNFPSRRFPLSSSLFFIFLCSGAAAGLYFQRTACRARSKPNRAFYHP